MASDQQPASPQSNNVGVRDQHKPTTLRISDLPATALEADVRAAFAQFGFVVEVILAPFGDALVTLDSAAAAAEAVRRANGRYLHHQNHSEGEKAHGGCSFEETPEAVRPPFREPTQSLSVEIAETQWTGDSVHWGLSGGDDSGAWSAGLRDGEDWGRLFGDEFSLAPRHGMTPQERKARAVRFARSLGVDGTLRLTPIRFTPLGLTWRERLQQAQRSARGLEVTEPEAEQPLAAPPAAAPLAVREPLGLTTRERRRRASQYARLAGRARADEAEGKKGSELE
ncbi:hypothetical protein PG991_001839 [Apiospora marii]|uniref:RRM domain-containing protein n=1 Tax=Apiospora marii TaxID=335849 RepID=A0ABR1SPI2_9PEZI